MSYRHHLIGLAVLAMLSTGCQKPDEAATSDAVAEVETTTAGSYPDCQSNEIPYDLASQDQAGADGFAWGTFLALAGSGDAPAWSSWPSTDDMIDCNQEESPAGGSCVGGRYVPDACSELYAENPGFILDEVGKVDDDFLEATTGGLSADPVLARNGTFLRYLIVMSPQTESWIVSENLQQESTLEGLTSPVVFPCSTTGETGSNNDSTILKLAFMDTAELETSSYYTQDMLVYTPSYRNSTGVATCEAKSMALVGLHMLRKTATQLAWVWGTFEHDLNAPDCTGLPAAGDGKGDSGPSKSCPSTASTDWNFYASSCQADGDSGACQSCNTVPDQNGASGQCVNPDNTGTGSWCLDQAPASTAGLSRLCRQVAPGNYYPGATSWDDTPPNAACQPSSGVWSNYQLISTQWVNKSLGTECSNVQDQVFTGGVVDHAVIAPQVASANNRPFLANTSMESYERADCMGCHSKATVDESGSVTTNGTDFVYFLGIEVPGFEAAGSSD